MVRCLRVNAMISWREEMCVGVPAIDDDHKALFLLVNKLEICPTWGCAEQTAKQLYKYTQSHFKREEEIQEYFKFPFIEDQKNAHRNIINSLSMLIKNDFLNKNKTTTINEVLSDLILLLRDWLLDHVLTHDIKMRDFLSHTYLMRPACCRRGASNFLRVEKEH